MEDVNTKQQLCLTFPEPRDTVFYNSTPEKIANINFDKLNEVE